MPVIAPNLIDYIDKQIIVAYADNQTHVHFRPLLFSVVKSIYFSVYDVVVHTFAYYVHPWLQHWPPIWSQYAATFLHFPHEIRSL